MRNNYDGYAGTLTRFWHSLIPCGRSLGTRTYHGKWHLHKTVIFSTRSRNRNKTTIEIIVQPCTPHTQCIIGVAVYLTRTEQCHGNRTLSFARARSCQSGVAYWLGACCTLNYCVNNTSARSRFARDRVTWVGRTLAGHVPGQARPSLRHWPLSAKKCLFRKYLSERVSCGFGSLALGCCPSTLLQSAVCRVSKNFVEIFSRERLKFPKFAKLKSCAIRYLDSVCQTPHTEVIMITSDVRQFVATCKEFAKNEQHGVQHKGDCCYVWDYEWNLFVECYPQQLMITIHIIITSTQLMVVNIILVLKQRCLKYQSYTKRSQKWILNWFRNVHGWPVGMTTMW